MRIAPEGFIDYGVPVRGLGDREHPPQEYPQQQEFYDDYDRRDNEPHYMPNGGAIFPGQDQGFLKWLFDFRKEAITPLRNIWRGKEYNFEENIWYDSRSQLRILNEDGITWGISLIESYMNPAFIVTDLNEITYNFRMREASKIIWNSLSLRYQEFDLRKSDIHRVAEEIESKISAILRGSLDNGYRDFFSTQNQTVETKNLTPQFQQPRPSLWTKAAGLFKHANERVNM